MIQRYRDWRRERRIARLTKQVCALLAERDYWAAAYVNTDMMAEIGMRSPQQVARMERARGLEK